VNYPSFKDWKRRAVGDAIPVRADPAAENRALKAELIRVPDGLDWLGAARLALHRGGALAPAAARLLRRDLVGTPSAVPGTDVAAVWHQEIHRPQPRRVILRRHPQPDGGTDHPPVERARIRTRLVAGRADEVAVRIFQLQCGKPDAGLEHF
jgi:hypothetical protein